MAAFLKLETGDYLLLETADKLLLEAQDDGPAFQANAFQGDAFQIGPPGSAAPETITADKWFVSLLDPPFKRKWTGGGTVQPDLVPPPSIGWFEPLRDPPKKLKWTGGGNEWSTITPPPSFGWYVPLLDPPFKRKQSRGEYTWAFTTPPPTFGWFDPLNTPPFKRRPVFESYTWSGFTPAPAFDWFYPLAAPPRVGRLPPDGNVCWTYFVEAPPVTVTTDMWFVDLNLPPRRALPAPPDYPAFIPSGEPGTVTPPIVNAFLGAVSAFVQRKRRRRKKREEELERVAETLAALVVAKQAPIAEEIPAPIPARVIRTEVRREINELPLDMMVAELGTRIDELTTLVEAHVRRLEDEADDEEDLLLMLTL